MSFATRIKDLNTHPLPSGRDVRKPVSVHPSDRSATPTTTPCARASSPRSNANSWPGANSKPRPRPVWSSSSSSKDGTTQDDAIPTSHTSHPPTSKDRKTTGFQIKAHKCPTNRGNSDSTMRAYEATSGIHHSWRIHELARPQVTRQPARCYPKIDERPFLLDLSCWFRWVDRPLKSWQGPFRCSNAKSQIKNR